MAFPEGTLPMVPEACRPYARVAMDAIPILLIICFGASMLALVALVWAISARQFQMGPGAATVIFDEGEVGHPVDPVVPGDEGESRKSLDASCRLSALYLLVSSVFWLLVGSAAGLAVSLKFHQPELLVDQAWLTFGRLRPFHLNIVAYGWSSMAGMGVAIWLMPRLLKTPLRGEGFALWGTHLWNLGVTLGGFALLLGQSQGEEWLEFPWLVDVMLAIAGALIGIPVLLTLKNRQVHHLYVSTWYLGAALIWFPFLFLVANVPGVFSGVPQAAVNWWFAHNVLGLWLTPLALAAAYYFIPKVLGVPIYSYQLSLLGFWSLALFYSQAGIHHLIGGPVPHWLQAISVVHSVSMFIPVIAVAVNHHFTLKGHTRRLRTSATLRFVVTGAVTYTLVSFQGSIEAVPSFNKIVHFTHYTVAHAHLGVYGFVSMILFGAFYFVVPRLTGKEWPFRGWIEAHYWLVVGGLAIYFFSMTIAGWLQGQALLNADGTFLDSLRATAGYLPWRSVGGGLMTAGHLVFATHLVLLLVKKEVVR